MTDRLLSKGEGLTRVREERYADLARRVSKLQARRWTIQSGKPDHSLRRQTSTVPPQNTILDRMLKIVPRSLRAAVRGRLRFQPFFERMYGMALVGMNYGEGFLLEISGELDLLARLRAGHSSSERAFVLLDVGANVGHYARAAVDLFGDHCRIHAFEPGKQAAAQFAKDFQGRPNVSLHEIALTDAPGRVTLYSDWNGSPVATLNPASIEGIYNSKSHADEVEGMRLDDFCRNQGIERIDLLKIDVEGHEYRVLLGAAGLIEADAIDGIQFEFAYNNTYSRVFFRDFHELLSPRYHLFRLVKDGLYPVTHPYPYEIFRTINYYARRKDLPSL